MVKILTDYLQITSCDILSYVNFFYLFFLKGLLEIYQVKL